MEQDKQEQLKSYMNRLPPPTQAELEALSSYSSMFLVVVCQYDKGTIKVLLVVW